MKIVPRKKTAPYTILTGDVREMLRTLPDKSVHCIVTSPPYWGLRDYGCDGQLGLEPTVELYVEHMVEVFREVRRVLREDGTLWLNMGDCYAGSWGAQSRNGSETGLSAQQIRAHPAGQTRVGSLSRTPGLKPKDLVGQPWRVAFALQADGWWLRSDIVWAKPNPMPESCRDRPTKSHEYVFMLAKAAKYFFDQEAVRQRASDASLVRIAQTTFDQQTGGPKDYAKTGVNPNRSARKALENFAQNPGANIRSVWMIPTQAYPEAHFATFPERLVEPCIKAGTSERGCCPECGAPWVRVIIRDAPPSVDQSDIDRYGTGEAGIHRKIGGQYQKWLNANPLKTIGWSPTCKHDAEPIPCTVLDPFVGSGTTALVAVRLGRKAIGIDLSAEYTDMVKKQLAVAILGGSKRPRKFRLNGRKKIRRRVE